MTAINLLPVSPFLCVRVSELEPGLFQKIKQAAGSTREEEHVQGGGETTQNPALGRSAPSFCPFWQDAPLRRENKKKELRKGKGMEVERRGEQLRERKRERSEDVEVSYRADEHHVKAQCASRIFARRVMGNFFLPPRSGCGL